MNYINHYESNVIRNPQVFKYNNCQWSFPLHIEYEDTCYYGNKTIVRKCIDGFSFSENYIWGDDKVSFYRNWTEPKYDHVIDRTETFTLNRFLEMVKLHNDFSKKEPKREWGEDRKIYNYPLNQ